MSSTSPPTTGFGRAIPRRSSAIIARRTRSVMEAALAASVERVVCTSSVATLCPSPLAPPTRPARPASPTVIGAYKRSKVVAERLVEAMVAKQGLPGGHRQSLDADRPARSTADADRPYRRRGRQRPDAGLSGRRPQSGPRRRRRRAAIWLRSTKGGSANAIYWAGRMWAWPRCCARSRRWSAAARRRWRLARALVFPLAWAVSRSRASPGASPSSRSTGCAWPSATCSTVSAKAERELGYRARPYAEALADAIAWFRGAGMVH